MQIDYYAYQSKMNTWNREWKVIVCVVTLCFIIGLNRLPISLVSLVVMSSLTLFCGKTPWKIYRRYMMVPFVFLVISALAIACEVSFHALGTWNLSFHFFYLCFTKTSVDRAIGVFFKGLAGMSTLYMLSFSTPVHEIIVVLKKVHLPVMLADLMNLIYRYIFLLFDVAAQMQTAAKARLGYRNFRISMKSFAMMGGNLFFLSMKKANAYADAMEARGYHGELLFLTEEHPVSWWQVVGSLVFFAVLVIIFKQC